MSQQRQCGSTQCTWTDQAARRQMFSAFISRIMPGLSSPAQVHGTVVEAMADVLINMNANLGYGSETSVKIEKVITSSRQSMANLLNAAPEVHLGASSHARHTTNDLQEIVFANNMTTAALHLSHALADDITPGGNIVLSECASVA